MTLSKRIAEYQRENGDDTKKTLDFIQRTLGVDEDEAKATYIESLSINTEVK